MTHSNGRNVVLIDGARIPFMRSGTHYAEQTSFDLARATMKGLMVRNALDPERLDGVIFGTVLQNPETPNVARDAALAAGVPLRVPAHTVTMACISANRAIADGIQMIASGHADVVLAGGVETLSDIPVGFNKEMREKFFEARKYRKPQDWLKLVQGMSPSDFLPRAPEIAEYTTGETMGESGDKLAAAFGVSRREQDEYALRAHRLAAAATDAGHLERQLIPSTFPPDFGAHRTDNTVRRDTSMEKLEQLDPVFVKPFGTVTAGNSSPLTDGAAGVLLMDGERARELGFEARAILREYTFVAQDPKDELLLGPAYATPAVLDKAGLSFADLDVIEIHEAFAGQVLAVLRAWESRSFAREKLGREEAVAGSLDMDRINCWGGSVSLGHPFGATGARLVTTAVDRLHAEDGRFALVTACAAGGLGHAMIVERQVG